MINLNIKNIARVFLGTIKLLFVLAIILPLSIIFFNNLNFKIIIAKKQKAGQFFIPNTCLKSKLKPQFCKIETVRLEYV